MWAVAIVLSAFLGMSVAWAQNDDGPMTNMHFLVVRDYNGKPVKNAAVVLHPVTRKGKQARGGLELKTDTDGRTAIEGIPYGPLRIQVLAPGFQTFGEDYQISKPETEIVIKMKRPGAQYSMYENHPEDKKANEKQAGDSKAPDKRADDSKAEQKPQ
jgi:hypothetical protein